MSINELVEIVQKYSIENDMRFSMSKARRIAVAVHKRMGTDKRLKITKWLETSDDYRTTTYSDSTGEQAVRNILKEMCGTPA